MITKLSVTHQAQPHPFAKMRGGRYWLKLIVFGSSLVFSVIFATFAYFSYYGALDYAHPGHVVRPVDETPALFGIPYQDVTFTTTDGLKLSAWYTPSQNGAVLLVAHGYHSYRSAAWHAYFAQHGYGVVSWDFRAHGKSEGDLATFGYYEVRDVEAALDFALAQPNVKAVGAWGGSMGGAVNLMAAAKRPEIKAVVADSAYATLPELLETGVRLAPLRPLIRFFAEREVGFNLDRVRPLDHIAQISPRPVFIIQGLADTDVLPSSGQRLYDAARAPRLLWQEPNVWHVGMQAVYPAQYTQKVFAFFDAALLPK